MRSLNERERAFVTAYLGKARGNGTKAAVLAGYARNSAAVSASRLLRKANIAAAIKERTEVLEKRGIADAIERDELLTAIARNDLEETGYRLGAIRELNKVTGRHILKHQVEGRLTLEQALTASREIDE